MKPKSDEEVNWIVNQLMPFPVKAEFITANPYIAFIKYIKSKESK